MKKLNSTELSNIKGGFTFNGWIALGITALIVFISGVIEGFTNPDKCRS